MSGLKRFFTLFMICCLTVAMFADSRIIAHVSKEAGGFIPGIIIANTDHATAHTITLTPYSNDGTAMESVTMEVQAGMTEYKTDVEIFGTDTVSHFAISGDDQIEVNITYQSTQAQSSPVHVPESDIQSSGWRIYAGNWDVVWDGLAIVNMGSGATDISIIQRTAAGDINASFNDFADVSPMQKVLKVLGDNFTALEGGYFEVVANQPLAIVSLRGTYSWSDYQYLWENRPVKVAVDFHSTITEYKGAETCLGCHEGMDAEIMETTHYKFTGELASDYIYDHDGNPVERTYTGKFWKLCGFPTALPSANWVGKLKDDPSTPHIDNPGGCGKCHIGIGMAPYTMKGNTEPTANDMVNIDCLMCHASDYSRKFYVATTDGQPDLNASGSPVVFIAPRVDGEFDFSVYNEAARTVGKTSGDTCRRCHAKAGGGAMAIDGVLHSFKRGDAFHETTDVHAAAGMDCNDCHYSSNHKMKRGANADLSAYDNKLEGSSCITCHSAEPHDSFMIDMHTEKVSCEACHATSKGGVTYKDFSVTTCPSGDCSSESLNTYGVQLTKFPEDFAITYKWFNGTVEAPIHPRGSYEDGKLYPYKRGVFNQPKDADGNPIPVKWGKLFVAGDMDAAISTGRALYESYLASFAGDPAAYGLPPLMGEFDHFSETEDLFSLSHAITKDEALTCGDCHSAENSVLDWDALGLANPNPMKK